MKAPNQTHRPRAGWQPAPPTSPGYYEVWDPKRRINRIVHVFALSTGGRAVRNFCRCRYAFRLEMWSLPCFAGTHWKGPIRIPEAVALAKSAEAPATATRPSGAGS